VVIYLIFNYKDTKNISYLPLFLALAYPELRLTVKKFRDNGNQMGASKNDSLFLGDRRGKVKKIC
jgi:hypothetical protein